MQNKNIATGIGVGFSLLYGLLFSSSTIVNQQELNLQDSLITWRSSSITPASNITLVKIDKEKDLSEILRSRREFYVSMISSLIEEEASLVVLNLPYEWRKPYKRDGKNIKEDPDSTFWNLIRENHQKIVLVAPSQQIPKNNIFDNLRKNKELNKIASYSHLISSSLAEDGNITYDVPLPEIQSFIEYDSLEAEKPSDNQSPTRRFSALGDFDINNLDGIQQEFVREESIQSFAWLSLEKYQQNNSGGRYFKSSLSANQIQANFWQPQDTFPTLTINQLCQNDNILVIEGNNCPISREPQIQEKIRHKIIIVGFTRGDELDVLAIKSPFREEIKLPFGNFKIPIGNKIKIPAMEVQANVISSLMTDSYYQTPPKLLEIAIYVFGGVIITSIMTSYKTRKSLKYLSLGMVGGYLSLSAIANFSGWMLPIISPILAWIATVISVYAYLKSSQLERENARKQFQIAEEKAIISQSYKLIRRIWSDIHDDPLNELKVAMDDIELLALTDTNINCEPILDRLSYVGSEIRAYLDINPATELAPQPELRQGLASAIAQHLQQLTDSGKLQLEVVTNLEPIIEPKLNSNWIDAREDIFRFFREAMTNVMYHAQGEGSTATLVVVSLTQEAQQCTLAIENDGNVAIFAKDTRKKGGMGTKLMAEMAADLPDGDWSRVTLANGGMLVQLQWQQRF